ncbi:MAG: hypothetical protein KAV42_01300 [Candidatus Krumholzibacteria bacterium]|nr:hypothetical protein [Candidatus Krumholzibacteria bacterium]
MRIEYFTLGGTKDLVGAYRIYIDRWKIVNRIYTATRIEGLLSYRRIFLTVLLSVLLVCSTGLQAEEADIEKISHERLTSALDLQDARFFYGGYMLSSGDSIVGPVVVISGSLDIQDGAVLSGDVWVIQGRLIMTGASRIEGEVTLVNSGDFLSHAANIAGRITRYDCECRLDAQKFEEEGIILFTDYDDPKAVKTKFALGGDKTGRTDYTPIGFGIKRENDLHKDPYVKGQAWISPSLMEKSTGFIGFDAEFSVPLRGCSVELLLHGYKRTFTNDDWMLSGIENSFFALMTGDDFLDYWEKQGGEIGVRVSSEKKMTLETRLSFQKDISLEAHAISSILFPRDKYRENPSIDDGTRLAISTRLTVDTRGEEAWRENAWLLDLWVEKGIADGPGDFSYTAFDIDVRRYNYLPWRMKFDLRTKIFSSFSELPLQLSRSLNGYAGVRGASDVPFPEGRGDRMALLSVELRKSLPDLPVFRWIYSRWDLLLFSDIGLVTRAENVESPFGFLDEPFDNWKKTAGIGFSGESFLPFLGFYMAQDLDAEEFDPRFILRMRRSF